jgi:hypothetical protein
MLAKMVEVELQPVQSNWTERSMRRENRGSVKGIGGWLVVLLGAHDDPQFALLWMLFVVHSRQKMKQFLLMSCLRAPRKESGTNGVVPTKEKT